MHYPLNQLLNDLFFSVIKFERNKNNYEIPNLFYNYHAVHYYFKIKDKIDYLYHENMDEEEIINALVLWERKRHKKKECECGENHKLLGTNQLKELFMQLLEYYFSTNTNFSGNILDRAFENKELNLLN